MAGEIGQGIQAAATAGAPFAGPFAPLVAGAGALLGGIFGGGQPKLPQELKNLYRLQYGMALQQRNYANSVPLSDPQEQAALASQRGLLGDAERQQGANLQSQYGLVNQGTNGVGDFLTNIYNQNQGQQASLMANSLQNALLARRQALSQASGFGQAAAGAVQGQYQQQTPLGPGFGELARLIAYNQTLNQGQGRQAPAPNGQNQNGPQLNLSAMNTLPGAGVQNPAPSGAPPSNPNQLAMPDMGNLPGYGMRNPFQASPLLGNPALAQVMPATTQATALNR